MNDYVVTFVETSPCRARVAAVGLNHIYVYGHDEALHPREVTVIDDPWAFVITAAGMEH